MSGKRASKTAGATGAGGGGVGRPVPSRPVLGGSLISVRPPADFVLSRDVCSYGYFLLAPNWWDVKEQALWRPLVLSGGPVLVRIEQRGAGSAGGSSGGGVLRVRCSRELSRGERAEVVGQVSRMLSLGVSAEEVSAFHAVDGRWRESGRGRLFRSPTLWEDMVKTVTSCNIAWTGTIMMNMQLCRVLGRAVAGWSSVSAGGWRTFPEAGRVSRARPGTLRGRCRVGYRDGRLIELAGMFARGEVDEAWLSDPRTVDEEVFRYLVGLPGIGPYAAGNIMQLLGRYSRLALDSESVRHAKMVLGFAGEDRAILKRVAGHYEPFGAHRFRSYWFELWDFYEGKAGPAHLWDRETTGRTFTASNLKK